MSWAAKPKSVKPMPVKPTPVKPEGEMRPREVTVAASDGGSPLTWRAGPCVAVYGAVEYTRLFHGGSAYWRGRAHPRPEDESGVPLPDLGSPRRFSVDAFPRKIVLEFSGGATCVLKPDTKYDPGREAWRDEPYSVESSTPGDSPMTWYPAYSHGVYEGKVYGRFFRPDGFPFDMHNGPAEKPRQFRRLAGDPQALEIVFCSSVGLHDEVYTMRPSTEAAPAVEPVLHWPAIDHDRSHAQERPREARDENLEEVLPGHSALSLYWDSDRCTARYGGIDYGYIQRAGVWLDDAQRRVLRESRPIRFRYFTRPVMEVLVTFLHGGTEQDYRLFRSAEDAAKAQRFHQPH